MATTMVSPKMNQFKEVLRELFQLNNPDLDFGLYRIMNQKREEVESFLEKDLLPQVQEGFKEYVSRDKAKLEQELAETIQKVKDLGYNPDENPKVAELRKLLASAVDVMALEDEVFSHLTNFFKRYYESGDFLSLRRYTNDGKYAIPYNGEEINLHWANADQYYIKTSEYLRNYRFKLPSGRYVNFQLAEASAERDNNKPLNGKERVFKLSDKNFHYAKEDELSFYFTYLPAEANEKQASLLVEAFETIISTTDLKDWLQDLTTISPTQSNPIRTLLERHLNEFTDRNSFDFFIHKDLGGFLRREIDFFLKNEVMHLDDLNTEDELDARQFLSKIKVIKSIAQKVIAFLEQLENFQKKLWLKKKFIVETNYCFTLDRVPEELYPEILINKAQIKAWEDLFSISRIEATTVNPGYSDALSLDFLKANPSLLLDTRFFTDDFKQKLLASIDNLDDSIDGLLINSDNFQAINLLQERYKSDISSIYIDPPYNTDASSILYKNNYKDSSWLTLMENRLLLAKELLENNGLICVAIDDEEVAPLRLLLSRIFPKEVGIAPVRSNPVSRKTKGYFSPSHEYALFFGNSEQSIPGSLELTEKRLARYPKEDEKGRYAWLNFIRTGTNDKREDRPTLYYPIFVSSDDKIRIPSMVWDASLGEYILLEKPQDGEVAVYPISEDEGIKIEKRWQRGYERVMQELDDYRVRRSEAGTVSIDFKTRMDENSLPVTWWDKKEYASSNYGAAELKALFGRKTFDFPKSRALVEDCLRATNPNPENVTVLDFFGGSGTTGDAVINLNRENSGSWKYILVEMGEYFDSITKPRIQKVIYSKDWSNGKPTSREGTSHAFKYIRLESYEDTLNNLSLNRSRTQQSLLEQHKDFREDYMLSYMLDVETQGSDSLLNIDAFDDPINYKMKVTTGTETKVTNVDLVETFNYLLGLKVKHIDTIQGFRVVQGTLRDERKVLVIWRNTKEKSNEDLERFFQKMGYNTRDFEFDLIFVNGDNNLENLKVDEDRWKVGLIEEEFKRRMFDVQEV